MKKYWEAPTSENLKGLFLSDPGAAKWQYTNGVRDPSLLDPSTWVLDQIGLDRAGNSDIRWTCFTTTAPTSPSTRDSRSSFGRISHRP
jgi:hypothetical protein